jgi:hypothetical protein
VSGEPGRVANVVIPVTFILSKQISTMRPIFAALALVSLTLLTACATTESRIADHRGAFDSYPAEVQQKIRAGRVDIGFTTEMVLMALGESSRKFTRQTTTGDTEVWVYHDDGPSFGFGFGLGTGGRHSAMGGGLAMSTGGYDPDEKIRVEFRDGRVSEVDSPRR